MNCYLVTTVSPGRLPMMIVNGYMDGTNLCEGRFLLLTFGENSRGENCFAK